MDTKKSPKGRKRSNKAVAGSSSGGFGGAEEHYWDCSVCTFRNNAEAFKCSMCDVRKGTSTRKPRLNPDLVAQQQAQALTPPPMALGGAPIPSSSGMSVKSPSSALSDDGSEDGTGEGGGDPAGACGDDEEADLAALASLKANKRVAKDKDKVKPKKEPKKTVNKARLKNIDRSSATYHSVTVNDFTVVITEYQPKPKKEKKEKGSKANGNHPPKDKDKGDDGKGFKNGKIKDEPHASSAGSTSSSSATSSTSAAPSTSSPSANKASLSTPTLAMPSYHHFQKQPNFSIPPPHGNPTMLGGRTESTNGSLAQIPPNNNSSAGFKSDVKPVSANGVGLNGVLPSAAASSSVPELLTKSSSNSTSKESNNAMIGFPT